MKAQAQEQAQEKKELLFQEECESREALEKNGGKAGAGVEFKTGKFGNAAYIPAGQEIVFPAKDNIDLNEGTVEYWYRPEWVAKERSFRHTPGGFRMLKVLTDGTLNQMLISHSGATYGAVKEIGVRFDEKTSMGRRYENANLYGACAGWQDGEWHKITVTYKLSGTEEERYAALYLDEVLQDSIRGIPVSACDMGEWMRFLPGPAAVDRFRVYSIRKDYPVPANHNYVVNPGFELDENNDGLPDFWGQFGPAGTGYWGGTPEMKREEKGVNKRTNEQAFSGSWSGKMESMADSVSGQILTSAKGIVPGTTYRIDGAVNSSLKNITIRFQPYNWKNEPVPDGKQDVNIAIPEGNLNKWVLISDMLKGDKNLYRAPENCRKILIYCFISGKGVLFLDDISLGEQK